MSGALPPVSLVRCYDTHRLIPTKYGTASVLARSADDHAHLAEILDLDHATNERLLAENERLPGIGLHELVFGVPYYRIVNAAFTHVHPLGSRFNGPERGAWYTAFELKTAQAEVAFHQSVQLAEIGRFEDEVTFDEYLSDFSGEFHELRARETFLDCLDPDNYRCSQARAERLLEAGSLGVVYPSVRRRGGTCLACLRPRSSAMCARALHTAFSGAAGPTP